MGKFLLVCFIEFAHCYNTQRLIPTTKHDIPETNQLSLSLSQPLTYNFASLLLSHTREPTREEKERGAPANFSYLSKERSSF